MAQTSQIKLSNLLKNETLFISKQCFKFKKIVSLIVYVGVQFVSLVRIQTFTMEQHALKNVNNCLNTNIYSYLETSGGQSSNLYLNVGSFYKQQYKLDICGSFRELFSCIDV